MKIELTKKQKAFIDAGADEVLFGGAAGGGKSWAQLIDAFLYALRYAGSKQLMLRRTFPELEKSLIRVSLELFPRGVYRYNAARHSGRFANGSMLDFGYCDGENDVYRYQSAEYDVIRFDELTHFTESMYLYLHSRLRGANPFPKQVKSTTNPGGVGHAWVKARFVDPAPEGVEWGALCADRWLANEESKHLAPDAQEHEPKAKCDWEQREGALCADRWLANEERKHLAPGRFAPAGGLQSKQLLPDAQECKPQVPHDWPQRVLPGECNELLRGTGKAKCDWEQREGALCADRWLANGERKHLAPDAQEWKPQVGRFAPTDGLRTQRANIWRPPPQNAATKWQVMRKSERSLRAVGWGPEARGAMRQRVLPGECNELLRGTGENAAGFAAEDDRPNTEKAVRLPGPKGKRGAAGGGGRSPRRAAPQGQDGGPRAVASGATPGTVGSAGQPGDAGPTRVFIRSLVQDNRFLMEADPGYLQRLQGLPPRERRALLHGDWDLFDGQFFPEFSRELHVVRPFAVPAHWRLYRAIDYGLDMFCCLWVAVDEQGRGYVTREVYRRDLIVSQAAQAILAAQGADEQPCATLAPPDLWNRRQETGRSAADIFAQHGVVLTKTANERVAGWLSVKEWLQVRPDEQGVPTPRLRIFEGCRNLIRTLPALQVDRRNPNDAAGEPHEVTHAPDALRAFCVWWSTPAQPRKPQAKKWAADYLEDWENATEAERRSMLGGC